MILSILIPAYNEEKTIKDILLKINSVKLINNIKKEIIIVDDCSKDNTYNIAKQFAKKYKNIRLLKHSTNKGKGAAIRTALKYITGDIVIIQDADLEYDPNDYNSLILPIIDKKAKVVYGSRRLNKDRGPSANFVFYLGGNFLNLLTNLLYKARITDESTCYKVFSSDVIKNIKLEYDGFEFCPEVTAKVIKKGYKIYEVPISYYPRTLKQGKKIRIKDGIKIALTLLKYRFKN